MRTQRVVAIVASIVMVGAPFVARSDPEPAHPDSHTQPMLDGCRRSTGETLAGTTPEWAYVYADRTPRRLTGPVVFSGVSDIDNPLPHDSYDYSFDVAPNEKELLSTANLLDGRMHVEWEEDSLPMWAWPVRGDRIDVIGSWVWDCGHWGSPQDPRDDPQAWIPYAEARGVLGEQTEIHPPRSLLVQRANGATEHGIGTVADLYISSDGTPARLQAECGLSPGLDPASGAVSTDTLEERATGVAGGCSDWQAVNDRDYDFDLPAPEGDGPVSITVTEKVRTNAPVPVVTVGDGVAHVHVPFKGYNEPAASATRQPMMLGVHIEITRPGTTVERIVMHLDSLKINTDLDSEDTTAQGFSYEPSEYNVYANAGDRWLPLHEIAPAMLHARAGMTIPLGADITVIIPRDVPTSSVRVSFSGRECDLPKMHPCATDAEFGFNDSPGTIALDAGEGPFSLTSAGGAGGCGCYTIAGSIRREQL